MAKRIINIFQVIQVTVADRNRLPCLQNLFCFFFQIKTISNPGEHILIRFRSQLFFLNSRLCNFLNNIHISPFTLPFHLTGSNGIESVGGIFCLPLPFVTFFPSVLLLLLLPDLADPLFINIPVLYFFFRSPVAVQKALSVQTNHQDLLFTSRDQFHQKLAVALRHLCMFLLLLGNKLQGLFSFPELLCHGIKSFRKFPQIRNCLGIISLGYLLGLPGQMIQVRMDIFQIFAEEIFSGRLKTGKISFG